MRLISCTLKVVLLFFVAEVSTNLQRSSHVTEDQFPPVIDDYAGERNTGAEKSLGEVLLWKSAGLIYEIDVSMECPDSKKCKSIIRAMDDLTKKTCIRFKERSGEPDYVFIYEDVTYEGCVTDLLGRGRGGQMIKCGTKSLTKGCMLHELGHALGLIDEHRRPDRDDYLIVKLDNVAPENMEWMEKETWDQWKHLQGKPFDPNTVMMGTDSYGYAKKNRLGMPKKTLLLKAENGNVEDVHINNRLSRVDVKTLRTLYQCDGANQQPSWPFDVFCNFDKDSCGFMWYAGGTWSWIEKTDKGRGGYLVSWLDQPNFKVNVNIRSINFHGSSPFSIPRSPEGCIRFVYTPMIDVGYVIFQLFQIKLKSSLDIRLHTSSKPLKLWSIQADQQFKGGKSFSAVVTIDVTQPFRLEFQTNYFDFARVPEAKPAVIIDDLKVSYTPCDLKRTASSSRSNGRSQSNKSNGKKSWFQKLSLGQSLKNYLRSSSTSSLRSSPSSESPSGPPSRSESYTSE